MCCPKPAANNIVVGWIAAAVVVFVVARWIVATVTGFVVSVGALAAQTWAAVTGFAVTTFELAATGVTWLALTAVVASVAYATVRAVLAIPVRRRRRRHLTAVKVPPAIGSNRPKVFQLPAGNSSPVPTRQLELVEVTT